MPRLRRGLAALTATALVLGACTSQPSGPVLGFVRHDNAVDFPAAGDWVPQGDGIRRLLPAGDCAIALGIYRNGYRDVTANWTYPADAKPGACDQLRLDPAPDGRQAAGDGPPAQTGGWRGGGLSADAAVLEADGSILAANGAGVERRHADGTIERLARSDFSVPGLEGQGSRSTVRNLAATTTGLVVNGLVGEKTPTLFYSRDRGRTLQHVALPQPHGLAFPDRAVNVLAAEGDTVVALGSGGGPGTAAAWRSGDGGESWAASRVDGLPANLLLTRMVRAGGRWVAFGGVDRTETGDPDTTLVLVSDDGLRWRAGGSDGLGAGRAVDVTADRDGRLVLVGVVDDAEGRGRDEYCGVVWLGDATGPWQRGDLGCGDSPPQAVTTLFDGRVLIAGPRDLWIRN